MESIDYRKFRKLVHDSYIDTTPISNKRNTQCYKYIVGIKDAFSWYNMMNTEVTM